MIKRVVISAPARGYVDGRFIGEEKEPRDNTGGGRSRRGKTNANADSVLGSLPGAGRGRKSGAGAGTGGRGKGRGKGRNADGNAGADNIGNTTAKRRGRNAPPRAGGQVGGGLGDGVGNSTGNGIGPGNGQAPRGRGRRTNGGAAGGAGPGQRTDGRQNRGQNRPRAEGNITGGMAGGLAQTGRPPMRKSRGAKKTPFRSSPNQQQPLMSPTQSADIRRFGDESKSGQFAEALAASVNVKRERLHKILAQSGHGSRRDMEILISSGRLMVNGIVATAGTQVAPGDNVLLDLRPIKLKFSEDLPRVLLYHKPEGEIVTTSDPGNRITVFDNLPRVENGKWVSIGRLDINTSGLLIFTTSGELANRFMHPRYEVEREYAVRILGELTEEQGQRLLSGIVIADDDKKPQDYEQHHAELAYVEHTEHADHIEHIEPFEHANRDAHVLDQQTMHDGNVANAIDDEHEAVHANFGNHDGNVLQKPVAMTVPVTPIRDGLARFDSIEKRGGEGVNQWYHVVIKEGRNREVRKMFEAIGLTVSRLIRIRFGKIELPPRLARGKMLELEPAQVKSVLAAAGMPFEGDATALPGGAGPRQDRNPKRNNRERTAEQGQQGQGQGSSQGQGQGSRPAREPREPRPPRNPRTQPRGQRLPRESRDSNDFKADQAGIMQLEENGLPVMAAPPGVEGDVVFANPREGQRDGQRDGSRNRRRARGGRGTQGSRDPRPPGDNTGNTAPDGGNAFVAPHEHDSSAGNDNIGNVASANTSTVGNIAGDPSAPRPPREPNAHRGRSRRNLRRGPRGPREPRPDATPPDDNSGNE